MKKILEVVRLAKFWRYFNLVLVIFWIVLIPVSFVTGWVQSKTFISVLSEIALVLAAQSSWQSSRVEHKADVRDPDSGIEK